MGKRTEIALVYEGAMPFNPDLKVRRLKGDAVQVRNDSTVTLLDVILIPDGERERGIVIGTLEPGESRTVNR